MSKIKKLIIKQLLWSVYVRFTKIIGVRGTKFGVFIKNGKTKIIVAEHQVTAAKKDPNGATLLNTEVMMDAGKQVENASSSGQLLVENTQLSKDEQSWMQFNAAVVNGGIKPQVCSLYTGLGQGHRNFSGDSGKSAAYSKRQLCR